MRRALPFALAAALLLVPAVPGAGAARYGKHPRAHKRHHRDQRVVMPHRRPTRRPPVRRPPVTPPAPKPLNRVQVVAREYSLTLSRQSAAAGSVAVELSNHGEDPHDLRVELPGSALPPFDFALTKPGEVTGRKLELGPGTWQLYCTLDGHEALGMSATFTVTG
jgi:hypothetical protein